MPSHKTRAVLYLMGFMLVFFLAFIFSLYNLSRGLGTLNIMPAEYENPIIMIFSFLGILKAVVEIWRIEQRH